MGDIRTLLTLELRSLYGINKMRHTKDPKAKRRYRLLRVAWGILLVMLFSYVGGLVYGLCMLGLSDLVPAYLVVLASLLILVFGLFTAGHRIFGQRGYDILSSMPIRSSSLVWSRFLGLYMEDLILTLAVFLPGFVMYGIAQTPTLLFYPMVLLTALLIPAIPLVLSILLGTLIFAASSRMKHKSLIQTLLSIAVVVGVMLLSFSTDGVKESFTPEQLATLAQTIGTLLERIYPPAMWLNAALTQSHLHGLALFALVSVALLILTVWLVSQCHPAVMRRLSSTIAKHHYQMGRLEPRSLFKALYLREVKRYFSSSIYVTNTILGPIMAAIAAIALSVVGMDTITSTLPMLPNIQGLIPFAIGGIFCMMTTTSVALSMEGKQFWAIRSLPIPAGLLFDSKILFNLSLILPFYIVSTVSMLLSLTPSPLEVLWLILIPASLIVFCVVFGITVNLKFHSFDWEKQETVVKQSLPAMLGGFAGPILALIFGGSSFLFGDLGGNIWRAGVCLTLLAGSVLMRRAQARVALSDL